MKIKAILFDMDGTLVDSERYYTDGTYRWMQRAGYKGSKEAIYPIIGTTLPMTYAIIHKLLDGRLSVEEIEKMNDDYFMKEDVIDYREYIFPEVKGVIRSLRDKGYKMALCSSSLKMDILRFIKENELDDCFDYVISGYECNESKPSPEIYLLALSHLKVSNDEAIVVEDSTHGIEAGKRAHMYTFARKDTRFNIDQSEADILIDDIGELLNILGEK